MPDTEYRPGEAEVAAANPPKGDGATPDLRLKQATEAWQQLSTDTKEYTDALAAWESFYEDPSANGSSNDKVEENGAGPVAAADIDSVTPPSPPFSPLEANGNVGDNGVFAATTESPAVNQTAETTEVSRGFFQRLFGKKDKNPAPTVPATYSASDHPAAGVVSDEAITLAASVRDTGPTSNEATPAAVTPEVTIEPTPSIDTQAILTKLQELLSSGSYDQLIGDEALKQAIITANTASITSADSLPNLRASISADINRRLSETGKFKSRQDQLYLAGKVNQLMDALLGADSNDGSIVMSDGRTVESGSDEYKTLARQLTNEVKDQQKEVSRRETKSPAQRMEAVAAAKGEITAADLVPQSDAVAETTETPITSQAEDNSGPATVDVSSTIAETPAAEQIATPDVTPTAEAATIVPEPEDSDATPEADVAPTKEADMARMSVLTESLKNATKDEIKGLSTQQVQELGEASKLVDKYSDENVEEDEATITAVSALSEALENAFTHQENYLSAEADDNWDTKRRLYIELNQAYDSSLNLTDATVAAELEAKIVEKLGEKPRAAQEKTLRRDWRRRKLGVQTEQRQGTIESKRQRGPEMTEAAVRKTIEVVGKGVGEVMAVPDHARNVYDTAATSVMSQVDRTLAVIDRSGNVLGTVSDEALQFVLGMPEAVKIATLGIKVGINEVADDLNVKIGEQIGKGVDAVKQAIERSIAQMKESAERGLQQRKEAREVIKQNIAQTEQAMEARANNGAALWGLLGVMKRLRTR